MASIDRPLLFIPGFGGTGAKLDDDNGFQDWLLARGVAPENLALEPLSFAYSDIVQTFQNIGYTEGSTYFTVLWDWRVPVAKTNDGLNDGVLSDVTAASLFTYTPQLPFSLDLPVTTSDGNSAFSLSGDARLQIVSDDLLSGDLPEITLEVSGGVLSISSYAYISGNFAFQIGQDATIVLSDSSDTKDVSVIQAGASDVSIFVGTGGPYFQDSNGDGAIDGNDMVASAGARGFALTGGHSTSSRSTA